MPITAPGSDAVTWTLKLRGGPLNGQERRGHPNAPEYYRKTVNNACHEWRLAEKRDLERECLMDYVGEVKL